jgi:hypothetical protein
MTLILEIAAGVALGILLAKYGLGIVQLLYGMIYGFARLFLVIVLVVVTLTGSFLLPFAMGHLKEYPAVEMIVRWVGLVFMPFSLLMLVSLILYRCGRKTPWINLARLLGERKTLEQWDAAFASKKALR